MQIILAYSQGRLMNMAARGHGKLLTLQLEADLSSTLVIT